MNIVERMDLVQLAIPGVEVSFTGLRLLDENVPFETYAEVVFAAGRVHTAAKWWVGDLLNYGEEIWENRYVDAMEATGLTYSTLTNWAWVCKRIARSRRRETLRFSHHVEAARFEDAADQIRWLDAAEENGWSVAELRQQIRDAKAGPPEPEKPQWTNLAGVVEPLSDDEVERATVAARRALERPLPEGHPLWRTQAESLASDVLGFAARQDEESLGVASPAASAALREACRRLLAEAEQIDDVDVLRFLVPAERVMEIAKLLKEEE